MGGYRRHSRGTRWQAFAAGIVAVTLSASLAACGGDDSSAGSDEASTSYPVEVVTAEFPAKQRLGETTLLRLDVRNTGEKTIPSLTVTISVGGKEGHNSSLPFGYRDPSPEIAQPDRPIWALAANYPRVAGSSERAGAETANPKTFDFGSVKAGKTLEAVWKLSAVRTGSYDVLYEIGAGLGGAKAEAAPGTRAGGSFATQVTEATPDTIVTESGEVVPAPKDPTEANR